MKFIDEAKIEVIAGKGGAGACHFHREKFVPRGGPDGGNGGQGGSIILVADPDKNTLLDFKYKRKYKAKNGRNGDKNNCDGKAAADIEISVPIGTEVYNSDKSKLIVDLSTEGQKFVLAKGGRGGKGNAFFKSATNRTPDYAQPGEFGGSGEYILSLKLLADIGLVGFPNAGKSTLISRISEARPKIADYPFTTLAPNLGVVRNNSGQTLVVADIPGLIPGASEGKGLGTRFLKHLERTRLIVHLIDISGTTESTEASALYQSIRHELNSFSKELAAKKEIVVLTKSDILTEQDLRSARDSLCATTKEVLEVSSVTGQGIEDFINHLFLLCFSRKS